MSITPCITPLPQANWWDRRMYLLLEPFRLVNVTVPKGFKTDGASVPRVLWGIFPPTGDLLGAAIIHDYLLERGEGWEVANEFFWVAMKEQGVQRWRAKVVFAAVQMRALLGPYKKRGHIPNG